MALLDHTHYTRVTQGMNKRNLQTEQYRMEEGRRERKFDQYTMLITANKMPTHAFVCQSVPSAMIHDVGGSAPPHIEVAHSWVLLPIC